MNGVRGVYDITSITIVTVSLSFDGVIRFHPPVLRGTVTVYIAAAAAVLLLLPLLVCCSCRCWFAAAAAAAHLRAFVSSRSTDIS